MVECREKQASLEINLQIWMDLAKELRDSLKTFEEQFQIKKTQYTEELSELAAQIDSSYCDNNDKLGTPFNYENTLTNAFNKYCTYITYYGTDYARRVEASKLEQQNLHLFQAERIILDEIKEVEKARKAEAKVSKELQSYVKAAINDMEQQISSWRERYNNELETRTQETTDLEVFNLSPYFIFKYITKILNAYK